jgi:hypothetical protein
MQVDLGELLHHQQQAVLLRHRRDLVLELESLEHVGDDLVVLDKDSIASRVEELKHEDLLEMVLEDAEYTITSGTIRGVVHEGTSASGNENFTVTVTPQRVIAENEAGDEFRIVDLPDMRYLMIDGHGDPNTAPAYTDALEALYPVAYKLKFASKRDLGRDYVVPPLEGLWWAEDMAAFTSARDKSQWYWTMMIVTPDWIDRPMFDAAIEQAAARNRPARLGDIRWESLSEGSCVQTLHIGPFDAEGPVLARMHHEFIPGRGLEMAGRHHEIYFSDPRKSAPEKLRTILRQPVTTRRASGVSG